MLSLILLFAFVHHHAHAQAEAPLNVQEYFYLIAPRQHGDTKREDLKFPILDLEKGYLTVAPPALSDGILDAEYVLFRGGKGKALLVSQKGECGPGCRYFYRATEFSGSEIEYDGAFPKYYPKAMKGQIRKMWARKKLKSVPKDWPEAADFRFSLPKEGTTAKVFVLFPASDYRTHDEEYFEVGRLEWKKEPFRFHFKKLPKPVSAGKWDLY